MDSLLSLDIIINCILVKEGVRHAMLLQPANYGETSGNDPKIKKILDEIKIKYPELYQSENYETYQGVLISKTCYDGEVNVSPNKMGEILGYPCHKNFSEINLDEIRYSISLGVSYRVLPQPKLNIIDMLQYFPTINPAIFPNVENLYTDVSSALNNRKIVDLFVNVCQTTNNIPEFENIKRDALNVLSAPKYIELFKSINIVIDDIKIVVEPIIPTLSIIQKLINNEPFNALEKDEIQNNIWNIFSDDTDADDIVSNIQFNNPIHVGILIQLLSSFQFDMLSPFYPLYNYPTENDMVTDITKQLAKKIISNLQKTKLYEFEFNI